MTSRLGGVTTMGRAGCRWRLSGRWKRLAPLARRRPQHLVPCLAGPSAGGWSSQGGQPPASTTDGRRRRRPCLDRRDRSSAPRRRSSGRPRRFHRQHLQNRLLTDPPTWPCRSRAAPRQADRDGMQQRSAGRQEMCRKQSTGACQMARCCVRPAAAVSLGGVERTDHWQRHSPPCGHARGAAAPAGIPSARRGGVAGGQASRLRRAMCLAGTGDHDRGVPWPGSCAGRRAQTTFGGSTYLGCRSEACGLGRVGRWHMATGRSTQAGRDGAASAAWRAGSALP
jgi:hypothetical protein